MLRLPPREEAQPWYHMQLCSMRSCWPGCSWPWGPWGCGRTQAVADWFPATIYAQSKSCVQAIGVEEREAGSKPSAALTLKDPMLMSLEHLPSVALGCAFEGTTDSQLEVQQAVSHAPRNGCYLGTSSLHGSDTTCH